MSQTLRTFSGSLVALATPFGPDGQVDYKQLEALVEFQLEHHTDGIVALGTTAETPTLSQEEKDKIAQTVIGKVAGRIPVIAGAGSNDTLHAAALARRYEAMGADGLLVVTPYYNKATQNGLFRLFTAIADKSSSPVILYNVPSRTGVNMAPETVAKLSLHPNINGIKEAGGSISAVAETAQLCGDNINIYSGNDDQTVPIMSLGGKGCISVLSNLLPKETAEMCEKMLKGDTAGARRMQLDYLPLIKALFCEVNPIPVKAAMAAMGFCRNCLRLPLTPMEEAHAQQLFEEMRKCGIEI